MTTGFIIGAGSGDGGGSGLELCDIGMALYIDETKGLRRYLNGQIVDINTNTQAFLNRLKQITTLHPSLLCTEGEWQTAKTMSAFGQVGKFVFNYNGDEIVSVRIPAIVNVQGLFDLQNLGMTVSAGLPNITGNANISHGNPTSSPLRSATGAFSVKDSATTTPPSGSGTNTCYRTLNLDASRSSSIYGNSDTVQEEAIQYPYFIQIATGSETENNIINDIELNNPFSLLDYKFSEYELNNLSWLRSNGQYNSKAVYPAVYDLLLKIYNGTETKAGVSVKLWTDESATDYDFRINTAEETFMFPTKVKLASGKAVVGNGRSLGLTDGSHYVGIGESTEIGRVYVSTAFYNNNVGTHNGSDSFATTDDVSLGLDTDPTKSGIELSDSGLYLYFYVGETVQNANLIDAGRIGEVLPTKTDKVQAAQASMPSDKHVNLTLLASGSTYIAPAHGWVNLRKRSSATGEYVELWTIDTIGPQVYSSNTNQDLAVYIPVKRGQIFGANYTAKGETRNFVFTYAEGENN